MNNPLRDETNILKKLENAIFARYKDLNADVFSAEIYHTIIEPLYETPLYQGTGGHNYIQDEENEVIQTLEEMKKKAREKCLFVGATDKYIEHYRVSPETLDTLIEQVWNARGDEIETIAEQVASRIDGRTVLGHEQFRAMVKKEIIKAFTPNISNNN